MLPDGSGRTLGGRLVKLVVLPCLVPVLLLVAVAVRRLPFFFGTVIVKIRVYIWGGGSDSENDGEVLEKLGRWFFLCYVYFF